MSQLNGQALTSIATAAAEVSTFKPDLEKQGVIDLTNRIDESLKKYKSAKKAIMMHVVLPHLFETILKTKLVDIVEVSAPVNLKEEGKGIIETMVPVVNMLSLVQYLVDSHGVDLKSEDLRQYWNHVKEYYPWGNGHAGCESQDFYFWGNDPCALVAAVHGSAVCPLFLVKGFHCQMAGSVQAWVLVRPFNSAQAGRTRHKEKTLGFVPSAESFDGRSSASRILDVVRGSITVKSPKAVLKLMESFKKLDRSMDRMILVRQINRFNREAETLEGYRFMEMHVLFRNGVRAASCGREGKTIEVDLLGEVCIVLEDFLQIHKRRHLLFKIKQGIFDWTAEDEEPDADVDLDSSLRGDDLPQ
ncbi:Hypothetical protein SCF082_LOCUS39381 [Durusdinium trenchii]|uniref:Uncharacterized protein n=1 Tax=Durusdinium trenchii TaxID=1381693 RepID=A0ABP0Q3U6_9DINO